MPLSRYLLAPSAVFLFILAIASFGAVGCSQTRPQLMPLNNSEVAALKAEDIGCLMLRAGLPSDQILEQGADLRDALAQQGAAQIRLGTRTEAIFAVHLPYIHVSTRQRGTFIYHVSSSSSGSVVDEIKPAQSVEPVISASVSTAPAVSVQTKPAAVTVSAPSPASYPKALAAKPVVAKPAQKPVEKQEPKPLVNPVLPITPPQPSPSGTKPSVAPAQPKAQSDTAASVTPSPAQTAPKPSTLPGPTFPKIVGILSDGMRSSSSKSSALSTAAPQPKPAATGKPMGANVAPAHRPTPLGLLGSCAIGAIVVDDWSFYCGLAANVFSTTRYPKKTAIAS